MSSPMEVNLHVFERGFIRSWILNHRISIKYEQNALLSYFLYIRRKTKDKQHTVIFIIALPESLKCFVNKTGVPDGLDSMAN